MNLAEHVQLGHEVDLLRDYQQVDITPPPTRVIDPRPKKIDLGLRVAVSDGPYDSSALAFGQSHGMDVNTTLKRLEPKATE